MKVLTMKSVEGRATFEIHTLNPGEWFQGFGGSRHALQAKKTASLIVRTNSGYDLRDVEYDIFDKSVWEWIGQLIDEKLVTVVKEEEPKKNATA